MTKTYKTCAKCKKYKPITEFYRAKRSSDGYKWRCKVCLNEEKNEWRRNRSKLNVKKKDSPVVPLKLSGTPSVIKQSATVMMKRYLDFYNARKRYISLLGKHYNRNVFPSIDILSDYNADCIAVDAELGEVDYTADDSQTLEDLSTELCIHLEN